MGDSGSMLVGLLLGRGAITATGQVDPQTFDSRRRACCRCPAARWCRSRSLFIPFDRPGAGRHPADPGRAGRRSRRTRCTCTTGCWRSGTRTAAPCCVMYFWAALLAFGAVALSIIADPLRGAVGGRCVGRRRRRAQPPRAAAARPRRGLPSRRPAGAQPGRRTRRPDAAHVGDRARPAAAPCRATRGRSACVPWPPWCRRGVACAGHRRACVGALHAAVAGVLAAGLVAARSCAAACRRLPGSTSALPVAGAASCCCWCLVASGVTTPARHPRPRSRCWRSPSACDRRRGRRLVAPRRSAPALPPASRRGRVPVALVTTVRPAWTPVYVPARTIRATSARRAGELAPGRGGCHGARRSLADRRAPDDGGRSALRRERHTPSGATAGASCRTCSPGSSLWAGRVAARPLAGHPVRSSRSALLAVDGSAIYLIVVSTARYVG